ncbi:MAG: hypothetical protein ACFCGT_03635 [Sandaracinaceae bacterium]
MSAGNFQDVVREAILSLPEDLKAMLRVVEDPDLPDEARTLAAGAVLNVLSAQNVIPGQRGLLAYVDDVIVLRMVLERLGERHPDAMAAHRDHAPELLSPLPEQMEAIRAYLGDLIRVLDKAIDQLPSLTHLGHSAAECARDAEASTWLYDSVLEAEVDDLSFDEDEVARAVKDVHQIKRPLELRLQS